MNYSHVKYLWLPLLFCGTQLCQTDGDRDISLSRRKRYVVFPEGSTFSVALCMTMHTLTQDENTFTEGVNWGISYDLPNESKPELEPFLSLRNDHVKNNHDRHDYFLQKSPFPRPSTTPFPPFSLSQAHKNALKYPSWNDKRRPFYSNNKVHKAHHYYLQRRHRRDLYGKLEVIMNAMGLNGRSCVLRALCEASQKLMPKGNTLMEEMIRVTFTLPLKKVLSFEPPEHHTYSNAHRAGHEGEECSSAFPECAFSLVDLALGKYEAASGRAVSADAVADPRPPEDPAEEWARYSMK